MLTSSFVNQAGVKIELPTSGSQTPSEGASTVTITTDGKFFWNSQPVEREQIPGFIKGVLTDNNNENNTITLQVDKYVTYDESMVVISNVAKYGGVIVIATKYEE